MQVARHCLLCYVAECLASSTFLRYFRGSSCLSSMLDLRGRWPIVMPMETNWLVVMNHGSSARAECIPKPVFSHAHVLHLQLPKLIMRPPMQRPGTGRHGYSSQASESRTQLHPLKAASRARQVCRGPCKAQVSSLPKQKLY